MTKEEIKNTLQNFYENNQILYVIDGSIVRYKLQQKLENLIGVKFELDIIEKLLIFVKDNEIDKAVEYIYGR